MKAIPNHMSVETTSSARQPTCLVCGRSMKTITNTHLKKHGMSKADYLRSYPNAFLGSCSWLAEWRNSEKNREHLQLQALKVISTPELVEKRNVNRTIIMKTDEYRQNLSKAMKEYAQTPKGRQHLQNKPVTARMRLSNFQRWVEKYGYDIAIQKQLEWQSKNVLPNRSKYTKIELVTAAALRDAGYDVITQFHLSGYYCDIFVPQLKLIVEVNGDYWHANPRNFKADDVIGRKQMIASQIWERDAKKLNDLKASGYNVVVVWEKDLKGMTSLQLVEDIVQRCEKSQRPIESNSVPF